MFTRRKVIGTTIGAGVALATGCATQPAGKRQIVDSQIHLWKASSPDYPWNPGAKPQLPAASRATHVRVAELEIEPTQLDAYKTAVTEEIQDSIRLEPGVLAIYCVALKDQPSQLRFFEVYADEGAYRRHIESPHFKKYVDTTKSMIRARKLFEMTSATLAARNR